MLISLMTNCQGEGLAKCLMAMSPGLDVRFFLNYEVPADSDQFKEIVFLSDYIFAHAGMQWMFPAEQALKIRYFPSIAFSAYHPDLTFVRGCKPGGTVETLSCPMYVYHSAIALYGFLNDINPKELGSYYCADVYDRLGYFDQWDEQRRQLMQEGDNAEMPLAAMFERWSRAGPFMYSANHPKLRVIEDIARVLLQKIGIKPLNDSVDDIVADPLRGMPIWPIYPEIAGRLGVFGGCTFKLNDGSDLISLEQLIAGSYATYAQCDRDSLEAINVPVHTFSALLNARGAPAPAPVSSAKNPYAGLPKVQFWRNSVANIEPANLDPVVHPRFTISPIDKVATAGSCFAQHIARTLKANGFNYFVPESAPGDIDQQTARAENYDVFSARFGNIYTVRQLLQLIDRVEAKFTPLDIMWEGKDGQVVDPFRPQIMPDGFTDKAALLASREVHFAAVSRMLKEMDIFVFTFGLTEGWRSRRDGAVFPLAPGVAGGKMDFAKYEFINFDVDSIRADTHEVIARLKAINPKCRVIFTVSPVPLIATYEPRHALVSTTYSKSILRVVADEMWRRYDHVDYFPSYEIITGSYNHGAYFADDLREVTDKGVAHVMRTFMRHYAQGETSYTNATAVSLDQPDFKTERSAFFDIVCDEEAIANF